MALDPTLFGTSSLNNFNFDNILPPVNTLNPLPDNTGGLNVPRAQYQQYTGDPVHDAAAAASNRQLEQGMTGAGLPRSDSGAIGASNGMGSYEGGPLGRSASSVPIGGQNYDLSGLTPWQAAQFSNVANAGQASYQHNMANYQNMYGITGSDPTGYAQKNMDWLGRANARDLTSYLNTSDPGSPQVNGPGNPNAAPQRLHPRINSYLNQMGQTYGTNVHDVTSRTDLLNGMQGALSNPNLDPASRAALVGHYNNLQQYHNWMSGSDPGANTAGGGLNPAANGGTGSLFSPPPANTSGGGLQVPTTPTFPSLQNNQTPSPYYS